jgi:hypothetical protein
MTCDTASRLQALIRLGEGKKAADKHQYEQKSVFHSHSETNLLSRRGVDAPDLTVKLLQCTKLIAMTGATEAEEL